MLPSFPVRILCLNYSAYSCIFLYIILTTRRTELYAKLLLIGSEAHTCRSAPTLIFSLSALFSPMIIHATPTANHLGHERKSSSCRYNYPHGLAHTLRRIFLSEYFQLCVFIDTQIQLPVLTLHFFQNIYPQCSLF